MDTDKQPLQIILSIGQNKYKFRDVLLQAKRIMIKNPELIEGVKILTQGFEGVPYHPALIPEAKKLYEQAIEWGLFGFLKEYNFDSNVMHEVYCVAYVPVIQEECFIGKLSFRQRDIDTVHMRRVTDRSIQTYDRFIKKYWKV